jgi:hypothetical protein
VLQKGPRGNNPKSELILFLKKEDETYRHVRAACTHPVVIFYKKIGLRLPLKILKQLGFQEVSWYYRDEQRRGKT